MKNKVLLLLALTIGLGTLAAQSYSGAESVEYDPVNQQWLVSNNANIIADDGQGNLSYFGDGATSYGVEVMDNTLFGISGGKIKGYDLVTAEEVMTVDIPNAVFLNGLTNDGAGNLYATDFGAAKIYKINVADFENPTVELIVENTGNTPNGIVYDAINNRLVFVGWGSNAAIKAVDLTDNSLSTITTTTLGNIDGIDEDDEGNFYLSSWSPNQISKFDNDFANPLEVISLPFSISNVADICYAKQNDTLALPQGNKVDFLALNPDTIVGTHNIHPVEGNLEIGVYPNPVTTHSFVEFVLGNQQYIHLVVMNQQGQIVSTLLDGVQQQGKHKVFFAGHKIPSGTYYCHLQTTSGYATQKIVIVE